MTWANVLKSSTNNSKQIPPKKIKKNSPVIPTSDDSHINNIEEEFDHQYFTRLLDSIFDTIHIENMCFSPADSVFVLIPIVLLHSKLPGRLPNQNANAEACKT